VIPIPYLTIVERAEDEDPLVLLGEPLHHVMRSPLFIILTVAGLAHLTAKAHRHEPSVRP